MKKTLSLALLVGFLAVPALADPLEDATYITEQTVTEELFVGAMIAQRTLIKSALENEFAKNDVIISDMDQFMDIFLEEFMAEFLQTMQTEVRALYLKEFTAQEMSDMAAFYATSSGQRMIEKTPALMITLAQTGQVAGQQAGRNAGPRVARKLEAEGVTIDIEKGTMEKLLNLLR